MSEVVRAVTLDEEIERMVSFGETDPLDAARKLTKIHSSEWIASQLAMYQEDILSDMFRRRLGAVRRSAEKRLQPGDEMSQTELRLAKAWVPGEGWKKAADLTVQDLRERARFYDVLANASYVRARWNSEVADLMEAEGAATLGKLKASLPALPTEAVLEIAA